MSEIYRNSDATVRAVHLDKDDHVIVGFSPFQDVPNANDLGFYEATSEKYGYPGIFVIPASNDWYQSEGTLEAIRVASDLARRFSKVATYGSSMGGFAALRFASEFNADAALAVMPQFSIDGGKVPFEKRWRQEASRISFRSDPITATSVGKAKAFAFYDPLFRPDRQHVDLICQGAGVQRVELPLIGHAGAGSDVLKEALGAIRENDEDNLRSRVKSIYFKTRKSTPNYYVQIANQSRHLTPESRLRLLQKAYKLDPTDGKVAIVMAQHLIRAKLWGDAAILLTDALKEHPQIPLLWSYLAQTSVQTRDFARALDAVTAAISIAPQNDYFLHQKAGVLNILGRCDEALEFQMRAIDSNPHNIGYQNQLERIRSRLQNV